MHHLSSAEKTSSGVDLVRVREAVDPVLSAHGVTLVELTWATDRTGWVLRVTIEREGASDQSGGVTLEDCANVSRDVSSVLDVADLIASHYHLEVSSPGLDRPLRTATDFARFAGKTARVKLAHPASDGQRLLRGVLAEAPEGVIAVVVDGKRIEAPLLDVVEANLVFELEPQPKKGGAKRGGEKAAGKAARPKGSAS